MDENCLEERQHIVDGKLAALIAGSASDDRRRRIDDAMKYSLMAGGKRLRPILAMAAADVVGAGWEHIMPLPLALELIHTYSLIHDDLPAMDDDDLRRGKPACHKEFDEATAILAGDALLTRAFELLSDEGYFERVGWQRARAALNGISVAVGALGMVGGQVVDMASEREPTNMDQLVALYRLKTGALLKVSVVEGGRVAGAGDAQLDALGLYGDHIGLAFQIVDDILDQTRSTEQLGKPGGSDRRRGKVTFPDLLGIDGSRARAQSLVEAAMDSLTMFGDKKTPLCQIADLILRRLS